MKIHVGWRIVNGEFDEESGEPLSWSNESGWGVHSEDEEFRTVTPSMHHVPVGGRWEPVYRELNNGTPEPRRVSPWRFVAVMFLLAAITCVTCWAVVQWLQLSRATGS